MTLKTKRLLEKAKDNPKAKGGRRAGILRAKGKKSPVQEEDELSLRGVGLSIGRYHCKSCHGVGQVPGAGGTKRLCDCVTRQVFRIVFSHYLWLADQPATLRWEQTTHGLIYGLPGVEFRVDFESTTRRVLTEDEHRVFRWHFLLGCNWRVCCRKLGSDRGTFFHHVYLIQSKLGNKFLRMRPAMFPLSAYFRRNRAIDARLFATAKHKRSIKWDYHKLIENETWIPRPR